MTGKTHLGLGIMATVLLSPYIGYKLSIGALAASGISSLLPDIDHPNGLLNQYLLPMKRREFKWMLYIAIGVFLLGVNYFFFNYLMMNLAGFFLILIGFSSHRDGITHSLTGLCCFCILFGVFAEEYELQSLILPFVIGYGMHLLCDMFTKRGVGLLLPFKKTKFRMPVTFRVGSAFGGLLEGLMLCMGLLCILLRLPLLITRFK